MDSISLVENNGFIHRFVREWLRRRTFVKLQCYYLWTDLEKLVNYADLFFK